MVALVHVDGVYDWNTHCTNCQMENGTKTSVRSEISSEITLDNHLCKLKVVVLVS